jgi:hypothetical protein
VCGAGHLGLVMWPAAGALIFAIFAGVQAGAIKPNHPGGPAAVIVPAVLALVTVAQSGAIRAARASGPGRPQR